MTRISLAGLIGLLVSSTACVIAVVERSGEGHSWPVRGEYQETLDLEAGGAIILENSDGDIEISGWEEERVDITAYRRRDLPPSAGLYFSGKRFALPDIRSQRTGDAVKIRTEAEDRKEGSRVHYILKVPRSVRLERIVNGRGDILISDLYGRIVVAARKGRVAVENFSGTLDIQLESGGVEAELLDPRPEDSVRIKVGRGDIVVYLEPEIAARFSLEAPGGNISSEIDLNQPLPARAISTTTGEGGISVELTALQGDVKIRKMEGSP
ncbi:MAG: hypothetical protein JXE07_06530 [Candidatus Aminicenantes bacterium]|nr:hypothetical protein [Candidatus Aminicenantes bacterium]